MSKNPIIVFEGIEGSGKTTHINLVTKYLKKHKHNFLKIREPGGSLNSEKIRKVILNNKSNFNKKTDLLLYMAARSENIEKILKKNYKKKIILIDRFIDSTVAYQHFGMGISKNLIDQLNKFLLNGIRPNLTILNLVSKNNLKKRLRSRKNKNRYDKFSFNFYEKVQKGFLKIAKNKNNYFIIDSNKDIKTNNQQIISIIKKKIN
mgnify:CR=1 FL=1|tara:strand:- start:677 stop:1291 length:615 start_codon:yes stop_codon:yes gene_type:complete